MIQFLGFPPAFAEMSPSFLEQNAIDALKKLKFGDVSGFDGHENGMNGNPGFWLPRKIARSTISANNNYAMAA